MQYAKAFGAVATLGATGFILLKLLALAAAPLFGFAMSALMMALKIGLVVGLVLFVYRLVQKRRDEQMA